MSEKIVGLHKAAQVAGVSFMTIRQWIDRYGIGEKVGHQWHIDPIKLAMVMQARQHLRLLQAG